MSMSTPANEVGQLCGSEVAHHNCRFAGPKQHYPVTVQCSAPALMFGNCPYKDGAHWAHHAARRHEIEMHHGIGPVLE